MRAAIGYTAINRIGGTYKTINFKQTLRELAKKQNTRTTTTAPTTTTPTTSRVAQL